MQPCDQMVRPPPLTTRRAGSALSIPLNRFDGPPLYRQLSALLEQHIASGELPAGVRLPTETELASVHDVNRLTVRQALAELVRRGLIRTVHGRGSYVTGPVVPYEIAPGRAASLTAALQAQGLELEARLLRRVEVEDEELAGQLRCTGPLARYDQLRSLHGEGWSLTSTWLPVARFPGLAASWDGTTSLHAALQDRYGVDMERDSVTFSVEPLDGDRARELGVLPWSSVLVVSGLNVDGRGRPVALAVHRFRPERLRFTVALR